MTNISIPLSDEQFAALRSYAEKSGITPEEYLLQRIEILMNAPPQDFKSAAAYVLEKNQHLYRRLGSALTDRPRGSP